MVAKYFCFILGWIAAIASFFAFGFGYNLIALALLLFSPLLLAAFEAIFLLEKIASRPNK